MFCDFPFGHEEVPMFTSLYLARPWLSCFEGEGAGDGAGTGAGASAGVSAGADAGAGAGGGAGGDSPKTFTQDEVNRIVAADRRKLEEALKKSETTLQSTLASRNLTEQERKALEENLAAVQGQLRTREQQAALEKKQMEEQFSTKLADADKRAAQWETKFRDSTIDRSLQDAAVKHDAYSTQQMVALMKPWTRMIEGVDEKTGKPTGNYKIVVDMPDTDPTTNEQVIMTRTPEEAAKRMKELPEFANLFKSNVVSGIGAGSATGGLMPGQGGKIDVRKLTQAQYLEIRAKNPELLGLAPKRR
jgi:hypothetical protein